MFTKAVQGDKILRDEAIRKAYLDHGYSMAMIACHAGVHYSMVRGDQGGEVNTACLDLLIVPSAVQDAPPLF